MNAKLIQAIEALLFVANEPVTSQKLANTLEQPQSKIKQALAELSQQLSGRGIRLIESHGRYSLGTAPDHFHIIERFLSHRSRSELSQPALETLAIIAYRQPITKSQIEALRGVASDQTLRNLIGRGLIVEDGQADLPGKPTLYRTNTTFLQLFGLTHPNDLPKLPGDNEA